MAGVTDVHVHVQPFRMLRPEILDAMKRERPQFPQLLRMSEDPAVLLKVLDEAGVERACLINYVAPEVMGFLPTGNDYVLGYAEADRERLIPGRAVAPPPARLPPRPPRTGYPAVSRTRPKRPLPSSPRLEEIGDKVLFGSDWPGPGVLGIREELDGIAGLPITKELRDKVLVRN